MLTAFVRRRRRDVTTLPLEAMTVAAAVAEALGALPYGTNRAKLLGYSDMLVYATDIERGRPHPVAAVRIRGDEPTRFELELLVTR